MSLLQALFRQNEIAPSLWSRRAALRAGAALAVAAPVLGDTVHSHENSTRHDIDWSDPAENLRILSRMWGSIDPGVEAMLYVFGPAFGMTDIATFKPLFRLESLAFVRTYPQENGAYRYLACQFILFTDWKTGDVLEVFDNPLTGKRNEVFQYRDGPLDYVLDPTKMADRYSMEANADDLKRKLVLDWYFRGERAFGDAIVRTKLKNRLSPQEWPLESVGDFWETFEDYRWQGNIGEIADRSLPVVPSFLGDFQTFKPYEPWMNMGQSPGKIFSQRTAFKPGNLDAVPRKVLDYAEKHLPDFMTAPTAFDKSYKLNDAHFKEQRKPAKLSQDGTK